MTSYIVKIPLFLLAFLLMFTQLTAQTTFVGNSKGMEFQVEKVTSGLSITWGMTFISDSEILFTQRSGTIGILNTSSKKIKWVLGEPNILHDGQGGLLDVAIASPYQRGDWIYFTYVKEKQGRGVTTLARAKLDNYELKSWQDLLVTKSASNTGRHFGSRIAFDGKGHLFFGVGDRGVRPNGQDLSTHAGTIIRLNLDGTVPKDNPFINHKTALPQIYSYGHRNPQGTVYDKKEKRLWVMEHGPRGGDEINLVFPGLNYGWPIISYGKEYWGPFQVGIGTHKEGMEQPSHVYTPSIAPGSLIQYTGEAFPQWRGNLFSGALKLTHLNRVEINEEGKIVKEERLLESLGERIRSLVQSPEGFIYFATDSGFIMRIKPKED